MSFIFLYISLQPNQINKVMVSKWMQVEVRGKKGRIIAVYKNVCKVRFFNTMVISNVPISEIEVKRQSFKIINPKDEKITLDTIFSEKLLELKSYNTTVSNIVYNSLLEIKKEIDGKLSVRHINH